jgi:Fe-S-cluster-containing hydrogenase component 2
MKIVTTKPKVDLGLCIGDGICELVCPVLAIKMVDRIPQHDDDKCMGCGNCEARCPAHAITMVPREKPRRVGVDPKEVDYKKILEICLKAKHNPKEIICFCTGTRAEEVAAAILKGATTPEQISLMTGVRTGCKVECIQPILRLLAGAGIEPKPPKGWLWYGRTKTIWEIPEEVKRKYSKEGFYFDQDLKLLEKIVHAKLPEVK